MRYDYGWMADTQDSTRDREKIHDAQRMLAIMWRIMHEGERAGMVPADSVYTWIMEIERILAGKEGTDGTGYGSP